MFEWYIGQGEEVAEPAEPPRSPPPTLRIYVVLLSLLLLVGGSLYYRVQQQEAAIRRDLTEFIWQEERARQAGLAEQIEALVVPEAPVEWKERYRATFVDPAEVRSIPVRVGIIEWQAQAALVELHLSEDSEWRYYHLGIAGWRRAPLPANTWGQERQLRLHRTPSLIILYQERDEPFARSLAARLPVLLNEVAPRLSGLPHTLRVAPREFQGAFIRSEESTLLLNSPALLPPQELLSTESLLRFTLARELLAQPGSDHLPAPALPGALRFREAVRHVVALRWALTPAEQAAVRARWQAILGERILYPFRYPEFAYANINFNPFAPSASAAAALLSAEDMHRSYRSAALLAVVDRLPTATSWERLFAETLGEPRQLALSYAATIAARPPSRPTATLVAGTATATPDYGATIAAAQRATPVAPPPPNHTPTPTLAPSIVKALISLPLKVGVATITPTATPTATATWRPGITPSATPTPDYAATMEVLPSTTPVPGPLSVFDIWQGDCFRAPREGALSQVYEIHCWHLHDYESYHLAEYDVGHDGAFPAEALDEWARELCQAAFEDYVARPYSESILQISYLRPTRSSWEVGDRKVVCLLSRPAKNLGRPMRGSQQ